MINRKATSILSLFCFVLTLFYAIEAKAEEKTEPEKGVVIMEEISVTATRAEKDTFKTPNPVSVISLRDIERRNPKFTPEILREAPGVQVQKTTHGHGSPIIRGLTGYHTLMLVDGVRLNNSMFREGPNQYLATVDSESLERVEVVRGPGSVLYGSFATAGVISLFTKTPNQFPEKFELHPRAFGRFASADREKVSRIEVSGGGAKRLAFTAGATFRDIEDIRPGRGFDVQLPSQKMFIVSEKPSKLPKDAWLVDIESPTGWQEKDGNVNVNFRLSDSQDIKLAYQLVRQKSIPRYDNVATKRFEILLFEPQNRDLGYVKYTARKPFPIINQLETTVSYHRHEEGNKEKLPGKSTLKENQTVVNTLGASLQLTTLFGERQRLTYGGEFYRDKIVSEGRTIDLPTGAVLNEIKWGLYPDGSSFWDLNLYAQDEIRILDNLEATVGGRYTRFKLQADLSSRDKSFKTLDLTGDKFTGGLGLVLGLTKNLNFVLNAAQAFRVPTLDDTTGVQVTHAGVDAPNPDVGPETSVTVDVGLKARSSRFSGSIGYYSSILANLIERRPIEEAYAGKELPKLYKDIQAAYPEIKVFVKDNFKEARIQGIEADGLFRINSEFSLFGNATFTRGKNLLSEEEKSDPLAPLRERIRREEPPNGLLGIRWERGKAWSEFYWRGAMKQDRLSDADIRDPRIPGTTREPKEYIEKGDPYAYSPGWFTLSFRAGANISEYNRLTVGVENILDRRYREHGSGVDASGTNLIVSLDNRF